MRTAAAALLLSLPAVAGCAHTPPAMTDPGPGIVSARLAAGERTLPGAVVTAARGLGTAFEEQILEATADEEGTARLELAEGAWYLTARSADGSLFGYYGPNPVQVVPGREKVVVIRGGAAHGPHTVRSAMSGATGIEGSVAGEEGPLAEAVVAFYLDATSQFRGPAYAEVQADSGGRFEASLSPGRYYVLVRKRAAGASRYGPLARGDHFGYYAFNPVMIGEGQRLTLTVGAVQVQRRSGWSAPSPERMRLSGVIRDGAGAPRSGFYAFLHDDPAMLGKPAYVSEASGADGRYEIWIDREGSFYLGARREIGQARGLGEEVGRYRGSAGAAVQIVLEGPGMEGFDIIVEGDGGS